MMSILMNGGRWLFTALGVLAFVSVAPAQMRGGIGSRSPLLQPVVLPGAQVGPHATQGGFGRMVTAATIENNRLATAATFENNRLSAATQIALARSGFYSQTSPYWGAGMTPLASSYPGYGGGGYGGGGYGGGSSMTAAFPTNYGAAIQPANSGVLADDIASQQADFQAAFQNTDLRERRLQLRRSAFDEALYEKMNTPSPETVREELRQQRLARARNTPPLDEIASGQALNELLANIQRIQARGAVAGPTIPVDPQNSVHINVTTTGDQRGSNELFKPGALSRWPSLLNTEEFTADKKALEAALAEGSRSQANGTVNETKTTEARRLVEAMKNRMFEKRFEVVMADYAKAVDFLDKLTTTVSILGNQDAAPYLNGTYTAKGSTVSQLADQMISNGLKFAKATPGDEPYYSKLYQQLVSYDIGLSRKAEEQTAKETQIKSN
jgi:hypothetical protein